VEIQGESKRGDLCLVLSCLVSSCFIPSSLQCSVTPDRTHTLSLSLLPPGGAADEAAWKQLLSLSKYPQVKGTNG
jgi:hypothetical protein